MATIAPFPALRTGLARLYGLRVAALHLLDGPLSPALRAVWQRRIAGLEQAICDAETRIASVEARLLGAVSNEPGLASAVDGNSPA